MINEQRFWRKVNKSDGCWNWIGAYSNQGYGRISVHGKQMQAHRAAWIIAHGQIPPGMCICHHCDNRKCVRADHLFLGTPADNTLDMVRKNRQSAPSGARHHLSKISIKMAKIAKHMICNGATQTATAKALGVSQMTIWSIIAGRHWTNAVS